MATLSVPLSSTVKIPMSSENHPLLDETYLGVTKIIIQTNVPLFLIMKAQKHRTDLIGLARATLAFVYELDNLFEITRVASLNKLVSSTHERVQQTNLASTATYLGRFFGRRASVHSLHSPLFSVNGVFCKRRWRLGFVTLDFFLSASNKLPTYGAAGAHPQKSHEHGKHRTINPSPLLLRSTPTYVFFATITSKRSPRCSTFTYRILKQILEFLLISKRIAWRKRKTTSIQVSENSTPAMCTRLSVRSQRFFRGGGDGELELEPEEELELLRLPGGWLVSLRKSDSFRDSSDDVTTKHFPSSTQIARKSLSATSLKQKRCNFRSCNLIRQMWKRKMDSWINVSFSNRKRLAMSGVVSQWK